MNLFTSFPAQPSTNHRPVRFDCTGAKSNTIPIYLSNKQPNDKLISKINNYRNNNQYYEQRLKKIVH